MRGPEGALAVGMGAPCTWEKKGRTYTHIRTYIHTYIRTYIRTYVRTYATHGLCFSAFFPIFYGKEVSTI